MKNKHFKTLKEIFLNENKNKSIIDTLKLASKDKDINQFGKAINSIDVEDSNTSSLYNEMYNLFPKTMDIDWLFHSFSSEITGKSIEELVKNLNQKSKDIINAMMEEISSSQINEMNMDDESLTPIIDSLTYFFNTSGIIKDKGHAKVTATSVINHLNNDGYKITTK